MAPSKKSKKKGRMGHTVAARRGHKYGFYCSLCSTAHDERGMKSHNRSKHTDLKLQCSTCLYKAPSAGAMAEHEAAGHTSTLSNDTLRLFKIDGNWPRSAINDMLVAFGLGISSDEEEEEEEE